MEELTHTYSVAIDGPAGAGKSTIARRVADLLHFVYVDTGAIYRTVGYAIRCAGVEPEDIPAVEALLPGLSVKLTWTEEGMQHMILNGADVTDYIRQPEISSYASRCAAIPAVRRFLLETQRQVARTHCVIMDGRDIGTVVLPQADVKIFLWASAEVRARRRWLELQAQNLPDTYEEVLADMKERDYRDSHREIAPLRPGEDAISLDTSELNLEESIDLVLNTVKGKLKL